jgi:hypothetical protein
VPVAKTAKRIVLSKGSSKRISRAEDFANAFKRARGKIDPTLKLGL